MHTRLSIALVAAAAALSACDTAMMPFGGGTGTAAAFVPVTTEEQFRAEVVGREVVYASGAIGTYSADNTWSITTPTETLAGGTWEWVGDRWCYEGGTAAGRVQGCERVAVSPAGVRLTREDGTQGTLPFRT